MCGKPTKFRQYTTHTVNVHHARNNMHLVALFVMVLELPRMLYIVQGYLHGDCIYNVLYMDGMLQHDGFHVWHAA